VISNLGAVPLAMTAYTSLGLKQIQYDTLSHILLSRISTLYTDPSVVQHIGMARFIYQSNEQETAPQIFHACVEGTYHNIPDFWDFWERLRNSLWRTALALELEAINRAQGQSNMTEVAGTPHRMLIQGNYGISAT
jgi:N-terminal acetyltransferase B complex non-catalytic subunit